MDDDLISPGGCFTWCFLSMIAWGLIITGLLAMFW